MSHGAQQSIASLPSNETSGVFAYPLSLSLSSSSSRSGTRAAHRYPLPCTKKRAISARIKLPANAAVFLDKDGTILNDVPYNVSPQRMRFAPRAALALSELGQARIPVYVVSNQSGIAKGYFPLGAMHNVARRLAKMFAQCGLVAASMHYCPFHPDGNIRAFTAESPRRKPAPGMLLDISAQDGIALEASWFIGDILDDVETGNRAGCRTILIDNGNETLWRTGPFRRPDAIVKNLWQAVRVIAKAGRTPSALRHQRETNAAVTTADTRSLPEIA